LRGTARARIVRKGLTRALALWHLTSLDAPTVAVVWSAAFAWAAGVRLPRWVAAMQALAVWAVYVGDRLLDARRALGAGEAERLRERHFFHWRHRRVLAPMAMAAACAAAGLIAVFMPVPARGWSGVLAAASLVYFARVHAGGWSGHERPRILTKEMGVGVLFTLGCALPAMERVRDGLRGEMLCLVAYFVLLAWLNCAAIERWEATPRREERLRAGWVLAGVGAALAAGWIAAARASETHLALLLLAGTLSAGLLALLDLERERMGGVTLRAAADAVLLTPLLLLWGWAWR
jgi:hypothetical protein